jgi:hypothetical protein
MTSRSWSRTLRMPPRSNRIRCGSNWLDFC